MGPPHTNDVNWSVSDVRVNATSGQCVGGWVCEHRWSVVKALVSWRQVAAGAPLRHWWDDGHRQMAFSRAGRAFIAFNDDPSMTMDTEVDTGLTAGIYCDVVSGHVDQDLTRCTGRSVTGYYPALQFSFHFIPICIPFL